VVIHQWTEYRYPERCSVDLSRVDVFRPTGLLVCDDDQPIAAAVVVDYDGHTMWMVGKDVKPVEDNNPGWSDDDQPAVEEEVHSRSYE